MEEFWWYVRGNKREGETERERRQRERDRFSFGISAPPPPPPPFACRTRVLSPTFGPPPAASRLVVGDMVWSFLKKYAVLTSQADWLETPFITLVYFSASVVVVSVSGGGGGGGRHHSRRRGMQSR